MTGRQGAILVIDDEEIMREILETLLTREGYSVRLASSGAEGLELARAIKLPTFMVEGVTLLKRMALVIDDDVIIKVFYPVFPPDRSAEEVIAWLQQP